MDIKEQIHELSEEMLKKIWIQPSCPLMTQQSVTYWTKKSISMN